MTKLRGMTWDHPRAIDPLLALSKAWRDTHGDEITWEKRSLQDFESYPVEDLARNFDLIVIDHPHVGQVTGEGCLLALPDAPEIAEGSVGGSFESYTYEGKQWAWPIDAAAQVQAVRPDLTGPLTSWDDVMDLARQGRVAIPLRPPHSLMSFFTLTANLGFPCRTGKGEVFCDRRGAVRALEMLKELADLVDPCCFDQDPIAVLDEMTSTDAIACAPLIYGYISYAIPGMRPSRVTFHDIASTGSGVGGSALGGTGIAVSAFCEAPEAAVAFARHIAGPEAQAGLYVSAGGQAGHRAGWTDRAADDAAGGFYSGTLATLDGAWMRPRHDGYMPFQQAAAERIGQSLKDGQIEAALDDLDRMFTESFG
ncbi:extracellular solute-binding protein [Marinibacterium profundimaris]|uniref:ABC transporter substrate-binding protein n=1 Tax=Marinibacterium profundimaris TaxID=1679460 RepID=A0A225NFS9_9RHOB|nr:extracellular solute-binding protein [Marinibacterium profundimaris]OWU72247.1 ABC transporter substrate-binding protein [Marinibacterium profundimaris]